MTHQRICDRQGQELINREEEFETNFDMGYGISGRIPQPAQSEPSHPKWSFSRSVVQVKCQEACRCISWPLWKPCALAQKCFKMFQGQQTQQKFHEISLLWEDLEDVWYLFVLDKSTKFAVA